MSDERITKIQQHLYINGFSQVQELAEATGASLVTIRRDLQRMENSGIVTRTHGGAKLAEAAGLEVAFQIREQDHLEVKRAIAEFAYAELEPHSTVFMDAGTTVLQLARRLRLDPMPLTVFTNGLAVAQELVNVPGVEVNLLGGQLRHQNLSMVGPYAERFLHEIWFDRLFIGATAIRQDAQLYTLDPAEASLNRTMIGRSNRCVLLTDASKFAAQAPYAVMPVTSIHALITDSRLDGAWRTRLENLGVETTLVDLRRNP